MKGVDFADIVIVRALGGLGDLICASPALAMIRRRFPAARISYIGLPQVATLVRDRYAEVVNDFIEFPGFPGVTEAAFDNARLAAFLTGWSRQRRPDLVVQMHGSGAVTNAFSGCLGARHLLAYHVRGAWRPEPSSPEFPDHLSETARWVALAGEVCDEGEPAPFFPVHAADRAALFDTAPMLAARPYAVVHCGAADPRRRWPSERFARIGDLLGAIGLRVVLTGVESERDTVSRVAMAMRRPAVDLCGKTSIGATAALVEGAQLVVTNDTGVSHLAAALGTPSVVVFITTDPARWAPDNRRHRAVGRGVPDRIVGRPRPDTEPSLPSVTEVEAAVDALLGVPA